MGKFRFRSVCVYCLDVLLDFIFVRFSSRRFSFCDSTHRKPNTVPSSVEHHDEVERTRIVKAITDAVDNVEHKIQHAIEEEVNNFFHEIGHHHEEDSTKADVAKNDMKKKKEKIVRKAKQSVAKSAKTVKSTVLNHPPDEGLYDIPFMKTHYPYDWPHGTSKMQLDHRRNI